ncbi:MAG: DUF4266 domain-containing protein [Pseudomonadales bacterium]
MRKVICVLTTTVVLSGCSALGDGGWKLEPWVAPFERNNLSDPIMQWQRDPIAAAYMDHVLEAREGARGATGGGGGGCGCN